MTEREGVLKPCPFCGGQVIEVNGFIVHKKDSPILNCYLMGDTHRDYWNRRALSDAKGQTKAAHIVQTLDANGKWPSENQPMTVTTTAGTAPGRALPKPIPFPVSDVMQAWVDYAKAIKSDYDALAAELERVKLERDEANRLVAFWSKSSEEWKASRERHRIRADEEVAKRRESEQRATTAEAERDELLESHKYLHLKLANETIAKREAKASVAQMRRWRCDQDCRYTMGDVADISGSHCPLDNPCERCKAERVEGRLKEAYACIRDAYEYWTGAGSWETANCWRNKHAASIARSRDE